MAVLTVIATPIDGDFRRLDPRIAPAVEAAALLIAEERKTAARFLSALGQKDKPFIILNEHSSDQDRQAALDGLMKASSAVFISDAGTPCVADPDYRFIDMCIRAGVAVRSVPGAASITAALSVSGFPTERFIFMGFPPREKTQRKKFFADLAVTKITSVFLERPYALKQVLTDMLAIRRQISVCVALGSSEERNLRGTAQELLPQLENVKSPFVVVVSPAGFK